MEREKQLALLNTILERTADQLGDITDPVLDHYYARFPQGREDFRRHDPSGHYQLEGVMVEQVLYCMMRWFEYPGEVEIVLNTTIPHHIVTLGVSDNIFSGLLEAVCDIVETTIPEDAADERELLRGLRKDLLELCAASAAHAFPVPHHAGAE